MRKAAYLIGTAASAMAIHGTGLASETVTYVFDVHGRLVSATSSGTVNNGVAITTTYDTAGNRTNRTVTGAGGTPPPPSPPPPSPPPPSPPPPSPPPPSPPPPSPPPPSPPPPPPPSPPPPSPPPPSPPPPPPPGNQAPVAVSDTGSMFRCIPKSFNVLANDYDPDGNTPLTLVSVSGGGVKGTPYIVANQVYFEASGLLNGTATVNYTMRDSLGATASSTLVITITSGSCGPPGGG